MSNHVFKKPISYKDVPIHPVRMVDIFDFYDYVQCLLIPKNTSQDINIIRMSYLSFLIFLTTDQEYSYMRTYLFNLLKMIFRKDEIYLLQNEDGKFLIKVTDVEYFDKESREIKLKDVEFTESDFDKIKIIIGQQNLIDIDEEIRDPELEQKMKEARDFLSKRSGKMADLEQQIIAYHCESKMPYEVIENLSIYQFRKGLSRFDLIKSADIIQSARYSGMVSFKDENKIPTWLSYIEERDKDDDVLMAKEEFDKIANDNGLISK